jgi:hypothetical protein
LAGISSYNTLDSIFFVATELGPIITFFPILTFGKIVTLSPIQTFFSMKTRRFETTIVRNYLDKISYGNSNKFYKIYLNKIPSLK